MNQSDYLTPIPDEVLVYERTWGKVRDHLKGIKLRDVSESEASQIVRELLQENLEWARQVEAEIDSVKRTLQDKLDAVQDQLSPPTKIEVRKRLQEVLSAIIQFAQEVTYCEFRNAKSELLLSLIEKHETKPASSKLLLDDYNKGAKRILRDRVPLLEANQILTIENLMSLVLQMITLRESKAGVIGGKGMATCLLIGNQMAMKFVWEDDKPVVRTEALDRARDSGITESNFNYTREIKRGMKFDILLDAVTDFIEIDAETIALSDTKIKDFRNLLRRQISAMRKRHTLSDRLSADEDPDLHAMSGPSIEDDFMYKETLQSLLDEMTPRDEKIFRRIAEGATLQMVADEMEIPMETLKKARTRARKKLQSNTDEP